MRKALMAAWAILWCMALVIAYHTFQATAADFKLEGKKETIDGVEVVWQKPAEAAKGVVLLFHGCSHSAGDFWPDDGFYCKGCLGLPEEMSITRTVLSRGYAAVALSSYERHHHRCWHFNNWRMYKQSDMPRVQLVIDKLLPREGLQAKPLLAIGASSGGAFVLMLPLMYDLVAVQPQIMGLPAPYFDKHIKEFVTGKGRTYPPTMFVHMPRDDHTAGYVKDNAKLLQGLKVEEVDPMPLNATFFSARAPGSISEAQSRAIYAALLKAEFLDERGYLDQNPRASQWREVLQEAQVPGLDKLPLKADESPLAELFNVAWASHEIVSDHTTAFLDWLEGGFKGGAD